MEPKETFEIESLKDLLNKNYDKIENLSLGNLTPGIPISFYDFDAMTQGLRRGDLIAFAGRPMMGKTSLALQLAKNIASQKKLPPNIYLLDFQNTNTPEWSRVDTV